MAQPDDDWGTHVHTPEEVDKMESPREKFDDWLKYYHWFVYGILGVMLLVAGILSRC